jgi:hypothetical protein
MEAGGMIAHARSSQIRNAENKLSISKVLEDNLLFNSADVYLVVEFSAYCSIHQVCMIVTFIDRARQISDLVVSS